MDSKITCLLHCIQRAKERYKIDLTIDDIDKIISQIKSGKAMLSREQISTNKEVRQVYVVSMVNGSVTIFIKVVFCPRINYLITVLPM